MKFQTIALHCKRNQFCFTNVHMYIHTYMLSICMIAEGQNYVFVCFPRTNIFFQVGDFLAPDKRLQFKFRKRKNLDEFFSFQYVHT
jgi:hypothetical protein